MIGRLQGILLEKQEGEVLLDVQGVAYEVEVPDSTWYQLPDCGQPVVLHTHFVVREDAQQLFGFFDYRDRTLFRQLIKVNGIGPRLALGLLSGMNSGQLVGCVLNNDVNALVKLPGVGRKTAERLVMELRDRLRNWEGEVALADRPAAKAASSASASFGEAEAALLSLGYKPQEASKAVLAAVSALENDEIVPVTEQIIRMALKNLGKAGSAAP